MLKKWFLSLLGLVLIPAISFALQVKLTSSIQRSDTADFPISPSISKDGAQIYLVYPIVVKPTSKLAAEIFFNNQGFLQTAATLTGDEAFLSIDSGFANRAFNRFTLIDDDGLQTIRLRLFDNKFNLLAMTTFNDYASGGLFNPNFSAQGGVFSPDGKFIVLSYLIDNTANNEISIIRVLNANDLSEVASTQVTGGSKGPNFFSHNHDNYVALTTYGGQFFFAFENSAAKPPSTLFVYKLQNNQLILVDQAQLPQQAGVPNFFESEGKTLIGVGTVRATLNGQQTIFVNNSNNPSFLPLDNRELRIYSFDGRGLKLILANQTGLTTSSPVFSPEGLILVNTQTSDGLPGFFNLFTLRSQRKGQKALKFVNGAFASPPFASDVFSRDGKWLLVTGSDQQSRQNICQINLLNNINLYQIGERCTCQ